MPRRRGDFLDSDARIAEESQPGGLVLLVEHRRTPAGAATGAGGGERAEDVEDELAAGSVGVDALGQRPEADFAAFEVLDGLDELLHGPS